jgi:hypothetical protein
MNPASATTDMDEARVTVEVYRRRRESEKARGIVMVFGLL